MIWRKGKKKYQDLIRKMQKNWDVSVPAVPLVAGSLGAIP